MIRLNAQELRELEEKRAEGEIKQIRRNPIYFILENIYDTYNIGGLFRLADALAIEKLYLCGTTEIPPNPRIKKASIGTYKIVPWEYERSSKEVIKELRQISNFQFPISKQIPTINFQKNVRTSEVSSYAKASEDKEEEDGLDHRSFSEGGKTSEVKKGIIRIIAVEQSLKSIPYNKANYTLPLVLIFGNESTGILPETLNLADQIVEIPMFGINKSLNVIVSAAIVSYWCMNHGES